MATITLDQAVQLKSTIIDPALAEATHHATINSRYYTAFKVGLLLVAIVIAGLSAYGATPMEGAKLASGVASALTVISHDCIGLCVSGDELPRTAKYMGNKEVRADFAAGRVDI
jgi:hypothetical protein